MRAFSSVLERSQIDGATGIDWLEDTNRRPTRQACLLNLLASLRTRPTQSAPLIDLVHDVFLVANDRMYAKVDRTLLDSLEALGTAIRRSPFSAKASRMRRSTDGC